MGEVLIYALMLVLVGEFLSIVIRIIRDVTVSLINASSDSNDERGSAGTTIITAVTWALVVIIWFLIGILVALKVGLPQSVMTVVSAAAIAAVGVGCQKMLGDVSAGATIIMEGQALIGDRVSIITSGGKEDGVVKNITLRVIRLTTDTDGEAIIPMSQISYIRNYSSTLGRFIITVPVDPAEDPSLLTDVINNVVDDANHDDIIRPFLRDDGVTSRGINSIESGYAELTVAGTTEQGNQFAVKRLVNDKLLAALGEANISIVTTAGRV